MEGWRKDGGRETVDGGKMDGGKRWRDGGKGGGKVEWLKERRRGGWKVDRRWMEGGWKEWKGEGKEE